MKQIFPTVVLALALSLVAEVARPGEMADMVRQTLAQGADPNAWVKGDLGTRTHPLNMVVGYTPDHVEAGRLLLEAGADPNGQDSDGQTPLSRAASLAARDFVALLLDAGANPNIADNNGNTPLHALDDVATYLAFSGDKIPPEERDRLARAMASVARALVEAGADPNRVNADKETPLHLLAQHASGDVAQALLKAGARTGVRNAKGETPLSLAVRFGHDPEVVKALLEHGADANSVSLVDVIRNGRLIEAGHLIDHGARVTGKGIAGDTPLHAAVYQALDDSKKPAALKLIRDLVDKGASPDARNDLGATPRGMARGDADILALFGEKQASMTPRKHRSTSARQPAAKPAAKGSPVRSTKAGGAGPATINVSARVGQIIQIVMKEVNGRGRVQATTQGPAAQAADLATLKSVDDIPGRIKALRQYRDAVNDMIGILVAAPARALVRARHRGFDLATARQAFVSMRQAMNNAAAPAMIAKMQADREWVDAVVNGYQVLAANRDRWQPNAQSDNPPIIIHDRAFVDVFLKVIDRIAAAEKRANEASDSVEQARRGG